MWRVVIFSVCSLITFYAIDFPHILLPNTHPRYVACEGCVIILSLWLLFCFTTFLAFRLLAKTNNLFLSSQKIFNSLSRSQKQRYFFVSHLCMLVNKVWIVSIWKEDRLQNLAYIKSKTGLRIERSGTLWKMSQNLKVYYQYLQKIGSQNGLSKQLNSLKRESKCHEFSQQNFVIYCTKGCSKMRNYHYSQQTII